MTTQATPPARPAPKPSRMSLENVTSARKKSPDRVLLYGPSGVGKTQWAASAPSPVFLPTERGVDDLGPSFAHVKAFPQPETFDEALAAVKTLARPSPFKTFVVDTVDWLEPLIWKHLCSRNGWSSIEEPGFSKGQVAAGEFWRVFMLELERMQDTSGMDVILLGHSVLKTVQNASGADYLRNELKLDKHAVAIVKEWTKNNFFATKLEGVAKSKGDKTAKVTSVGARVLYTQQGRGWDAKNRHGLPECLPLEYAEYVAARALGQTAPPEQLEAEARALFIEWAPETTVALKIAARLDAAKGDSAALATAVSFLKAKVAEKEGAA